MTVQAGTGVAWPRVSVVVPALNEARNLSHVFARMLSTVHEVIFVDGLSVDGTVAIARQLRPGARVFWRRLAPVLGLDATSLPPPGGDGRLWGGGFEVETLIHVRAAKAGLIITEVPSFEHPRIHGVSNLNAVRDGIRVRTTSPSGTAPAGRPPWWPPGNRSLGSTASRPIRPCQRVDTGAGWDRGS